jgi:hypothetical protein
VSSVVPKRSLNAIFMQITKKNHNTFIQIADQFAYLLLEKKHFTLANATVHSKKTVNCFQTVQ